MQLLLYQVRIFYCYPWNLKRRGKILSNVLQYLVDKVFTVAMLKKIMFAYIFIHSFVLLLLHGGGVMLLYQINETLLNAKIQSALHLLG